MRKGEIRIRFRHGEEGSNVNTNVKGELYPDTSIMALIEAMKYVVDGDNSEMKDDLMYLVKKIEQSTIEGLELIADKYDAGV